MKSCSLKSETVTAVVEMRNDALDQAGSDRNGEVDRCNDNLKTKQTMFGNRLHLRSKYGGQNDFQES